MKEVKIGTSRAETFLEDADPWGTGFDHLGVKSVAGVTQVAQLRIQLRELNEVKSPKPTPKPTPTTKPTPKPTPTTEPTPKPPRGGKRGRSPDDDDDLEALDESPDTSSTPVEDKRVLLHLLMKAEVAKAMSEYSTSSPSTNTSWDKYVTREQASRLLAPSGTCEPSKPSAETLTMRNDAEAPVTMADRLMQSQVMLPCR